jgi:RNA polymerase sigma factor (sigma-70 family)
MPPDPFEAERPHLLAVAYRMLGSRAEAEDAVQEAWLRWHRARAGGEIHDLRGWLTTITGRICLDVLKSARVRREAYPGQWLPEPVVSFLDDPAEQVTQRLQVSLALLVVLEKLTPEQRVAVVLHDAFAVPFDEVAAVLNTSVSPRARPGTPRISSSSARCWRRSWPRRLPATCGRWRPCSRPRWWRSATAAAWSAPAATRSSAGKG